MSALNPAAEVAAAIPERFSASSRLARLDGFTLEIIDRPGETLGAATEVVLDALMTLSRENLTSDPASYLHRHLAEASALIVVRLEGRIVGLSLASLDAIGGDRYLWVRQTVLAPEARGGMFMQRVTGVHLWRAVRAAWPRPFYLLTRTANPRVVGSLLAAPQVYPRPGRPTPARLREAAVAFCRAHGCLASFDAEAMVLRDAVVQAGDDQGPPHRDPRVNDFCRAHLRSGGDRFLLIARVGWLDAAASSLMTGVRGRLMRGRG